MRLGLLVIDITPKSKLFTFANEQGVLLPSGLNQYVCSLQAGGVRAQRVNSLVIPAGTGVLLEGTPGQYVLQATMLTPAMELFDGNDLIPVITERHIDDAGNAMLLRNNEFWQMDANGVVPSGKAYLRK